MFIGLDQIPEIPQEKLDALYRRHYNGAFYRLLEMSRVNIRFSRAEGIYLWDTDGNRYLDFIAGYGSLNLGHNNPLVIEAVKEHFHKPNLMQQSANIYNAVLASDISELTSGKLPVCCLTNCGTETVEEAVKLAWMYKKGGVVVYCSNAYHGKTIGSLSALGNKLKKNYPLLGHTFLEVPFGDIGKLRKAAERHDVAAFLVEPVQGEGGIVVPPQGYFNAVRALCDKHEIVLILDEIQTGLGRCGTMFCYEQFGIVPDVLCLSKSLSGGIIPVGCVAASRKLWDATYGKLRNATFPTTTFGGNTLASVAAIRALSVIREESLCERAGELGKYAMKRLGELRAAHSIITDVRGLGLFIGIEFGGLKKLRAKMAMELMISTVISKMLNEHHILCGFTSNNPAVLRFEPPLTVTKEDIDCFVDSLDTVLKDENGEFRLFLDAVSNAGRGLAGSRR